MEFLETTVFTRQIIDLMEDEEYSIFQRLLTENPVAGAVVQGGGGIRKIRVAARSHGKRGGARVIYYWAKRHDQILFLLAYAKNVASDLTPKQAVELGKLVKKEFGNESGTI